ncbi:MAG: chromosome segregation protein SMC [Planctomycetota bacterium]
MLKALELTGFKSFADRTRFDFPDGITVIVGPNGSGKSNVVDAMKWVLGSQSAKSLRGKEMSDVIFKGSQTRGPAGAAEATIVFDNREGKLPIDAPEVQVTRRVYRSGEGEYLINGQAVRLKDVRALIRGTGIGIDAYSLIEQGKVDRMLQANAKDRRAIFEEAAGISRFKAKKDEAERRLARVQQNLTRLGDIVDEVAGRLKSLKSQAGKAERYRQATTRLQELRTIVAWTDWNGLSEEIGQAREQLTAAESEREAAQGLREGLQEKRQAVEMKLQEIADAARAAETRQSELSGEIAKLEGRRESDVATRLEQRGALAGHLRRLRTMRREAGNARLDLQTALDACQAAQIALSALIARCDEAEQKRNLAQGKAESIQSEREERQRNHLATVRKVADQEAARQRTAQQIAETGRGLQELTARLANANEQVAVAQSDVTAATAVTERLNEEIAQTQREVENASSKLAESKRLHKRRDEEVASLRIRLQGITERARVLEELQQRREGVSGGAREVLRLPSGELRDDLVGLVADLFTVDQQVAPLIDSALGGRNQYIVVRGGKIGNAIAAGELKLESRVGIIRLDELPARRPGDRIRLDGLAGVIGRADKMVDCEESLQPLVRHLLSNTWVIDTLQTALGLRKLSGAGLRFVTAAGELMDNDGSTVVGPPGGDAALVSRRSDLQAARNEIEHYRFQIGTATEETERLASRVDEEEADLGRREQRLRDLVTQHAAAEAKQQHASERLETRQGMAHQLTDSFQQLEATREAARTEDAALAEALVNGKRLIEELEEQLREVDEQAAASGAELQSAQSEAMALSVDTARQEQQVESLMTAADVARRDQDQRQRAEDELQASIVATRERIEQLEARMVDADSQLETLQQQSQASTEALTRLANEAKQQREATKQVQIEADAATEAAAAAVQALATVQASLESATLRRDTLADRLKEDYDLDLHLAEPPEALQEIDDREAMENEITKLRSQVQNVGSINMEALDELNELQDRYDELHGQYQDLTAAKDSLQRIIVRINTDSRRLFLDTLEAIRQNFQKLYRKSFGGGQADLVLEESDDPLEAGVDIVATPPGKPSFSNSLLSGGEKALTAVALLMAIFQYRPSPFCVLDEVDAPFDEANIGRFVTVLTEFLDQSKFIVVTHSKKTMTAADTLYGVTMQESGVSKQVSIRFEDVSDDGQISAA